MHQPLLCLALFGLLACLAGPVAAGCAARSGPDTAALVELYTSAGCSSCPPADRWLSGLAGRAGLVPLALYVDYSDYSGSRDNRIRRRLTPLQRMALVYTPQVLLQGRDFRAWGTRAFDEALERVNAQPARAAIELSIRAAGERALDVQVAARLLGPVDKGDAALYLAAFANRLIYVVLEWQGPFDIGPGVQLERQHRLPLVPGAAAANSGVAAFIQDRTSAAVLQALALPACFS